ncbi:hypothetical protein [Arthrobacter sp. CDRTa11]|nr:hypothetical protein [Arthrobacter sp. CDRTa11]
MLSTPESVNRFSLDVHGDGREKSTTPAAWVKVMELDRFDLR